MILKQKTHASDCVQYVPLTLNKAYPEIIYRTGDIVRYLPDGRLFVSFRDMCHESPTRGDWCGWVGTYEDIAEGREGQYRVRLMKNHSGVDCAYPGVEVHPDGTVSATTYGAWTPGEKHYIVNVRFKPPVIG